MIAHAVAHAIIVVVRATTTITTVDHVAATINVQQNMAQSRNGEHGSKLAYILNKF